LDTETAGWFDAAVRKPGDIAVLTVQILLSIALAIALLVPAVRIAGRMRRDEEDDNDRTVFVFLVLGLCFFAAFLRWWFVPWLRMVT